MAAFHADLSITVTTYAAAADVDVRTTFNPGECYLALDTASVVAFSFDGKNDHGRLKGDTAPLYFTHQRRLTGDQRIWFRVVSGANPATVHASVWTSIGI